MQPRAPIAFVVASLISAGQLACSGGGGSDPGATLVRVTAADTDALGEAQRLELDLAEAVVYRLDGSSGAIALDRIDLVVGGAPRALVDAVPPRALASIPERAVDLAGDRSWLAGAVGEPTDDATLPQPLMMKYQCMYCDDGVCWIEPC